jgi:O-antigen/teichoic acid export membrane protein
MNVLDPFDYGLMGMVLPIYIFGGMIANFAQDRSIIAAPSIDQDTLSSLFWTKSILAIGIAALFLLVKSLIVQFYAEPKLNSIIIWLSFLLIFQSFSDVYKAIMYRRFSFKALALIEIFTIGCSGIVGYILALNGWAFQALIAKEVIAVVLMFVLMALVSKWIPYLFFSWKKVKRHWKFGKNVTTARLMNYFSRNLDDILVGKKFGSSSLGIYSKSYSLLTLPLTLISKSFVTATLPSMPHLRDQKEQANEMYLKVVRSVLLLNTPLCIILFFGAEDIVNLLLPSVWDETVPLIKLFCVLSSIQAIGPLNDLIYEGMDHTDKIVRYTIISHLITISGIVTGYFLGANVFELAAFYVGGNFLTFFTNQYFVHRMTGLKIRKLITNIIPYFVLALLASIIMLIVLSIFTFHNPLLHLTIVIALSLVFFYAPMTILFPSQFTELKTALMKLLLSIK